MPARTATLFGLLFLLSAARADTALRAGAAKIDITPPIGYPMWGYAARHERPSEGLLDPLYARALILEAGGRRLAIVSLDLGRAPTRASTAAIRKRVADAGVGTVFLVASHTHNGPVLELDTWPSREHPYVRDLEQKIGDAISEATRRLRAARLAVASKEVPFNRNRQSSRADAPVDRELTVLRIEALDGTPIAHAVNFAAHPVLTDGKLLKFSADFPGALAGLVERETGAPCLFLQGAAGDLSPNPGDARGPGAFGQLLGREVLDLARRAKPIAADRIDAREDDFRFARRIDVGNPLIKALLSRAFFPDLVDFYDREYRDGVRPHLTTALVGDRLGLVGVSGEFFSSHALSLKRRARLDALLFLGYCNDYQQYFPTIEAAAEGGYGTSPEIAPAELGAGERVTDRALLRLYEMRGRLSRDASAP